MTDDPTTLADGLTADLSAATQEGEALAAVLADLETRAETFGAALTGALTRASAGGRSLDEILKTTGARLIDIALSAGLNPLHTTLSAGIGAGLDGLTRLIAPAGAAASGGIATPSFLTGRLPARGGSLSPPVSGAAGPGTGLAAGRAGAGPPTVVFNVTASDAASFRRSEGQIAAMLTRTVGRGRRGV